MNAERWYEKHLHKHSNRPRTMTAEHAPMSIGWCAQAQSKHSPSPAPTGGGVKAMFSRQGSFTSDCQQYGFYFHFIVQFFFVAARAIKIRFISCLRIRSV